MNHDEYKEQLSAFLDGELTDAERDDVLAHLETCAACRSYLAELTALHDALGDMEDVDVPEGFADGVIARLHEESAPQKAKKRSPWRDVATLAACAAVVVLAISNMPRMGGSSGSTESAPATDASSSSIQSSSFAATTATTTADSAVPEEAEDSMGYDYAAELMMAPATPEAAETPMAITRNGASDETAAQGEAKLSTPATAEQAEFDAGAGEPLSPVLTLMGDGAAEWLAEHGEPLGDGRWLVTVEAVNTLPDMLELVAEDGLQEPVDGTLIITFGTTENPR